MSLSPCCSECGAPLKTDGTCPRCHGLQEREAPLPSAGQKNPWAFSLAELLLGTTYIAILLGVTLPFPEWGAVLWVLSAVALARTAWLSIAWKRAGRPFTPLAQIGSYAESLLVGVLVSAAASAAFFGVCFPLGATVFQCCSPSHSDFLVGAAFVLGGVAGLASGGYLLWTLCLRDFVYWFWRQGPPTMLDRGLALARAVITLATAMLTSALDATVGGLTWLVASHPDHRDAKGPRVALYFLLLAGYIAGAAAGIVAGRIVARAAHQWFWPLLIPALVLLAGASLTFAIDALTGSGDSAIFTLPVIGLLLTLIMGLALNRVLPRGDGKKP